MRMVILGDLTSSYELLSAPHWKEIVKTVIRRDIEERCAREQTPVPEYLTLLPVVTFSPEITPGADGIMQTFVTEFQTLDSKTQDELQYGIGFATQELCGTALRGHEQVLGSLVQFIRMLGPNLPRNRRRDMLNWIKDETVVPISEKLRETILFQLEA